ncbi:RNA polymerase sigma factor [Nannocystis pusilla]|uniref:RNA polymerase sigma factor n=1 Tax=Nannocystis pusilla TaxID=889268 RepID=UPI003DA54792
MAISAATGQALERFLCDHFDESELLHLARGILEEDSKLIHKLPPAASPRETIAEAFIDLAKRHGFIDDEFFRALCAARPRLREEILQIAAGASVAVRSEGKGRVRVTLAIEMEELPNEKIAELLGLFRTLSGDAKMTIESVTKGSTILVVKGSLEGVRRLRGELAQIRDGQIAGIRVSTIESIPEMLLPVHASARQEKSAVGGAGEPSRRSVRESSRTDYDLLSAWREGDRQAGSLLFDRHYDAIRRFFRNKVDEAAEELVQQTFLACLEGRGRYEGGSFRASLFVIANRILFKHYQERRLHRQLLNLESVSLIDLGRSPSSAVAARDEQRILVDALRRIPLASQVVLELLYWERFSDADSVTSSTSPRIWCRSGCGGPGCNSSEPWKSSCPIRPSVSGWLRTSTSGQRLSVCD